MFLLGVKIFQSFLCQPYNKATHRDHNHQTDQFFTITENKEVPHSEPENVWYFCKKV